MSGGKRELVSVGGVRGVLGGEKYSTTHGLAQSNKRARISQQKEVMLVFDGDLATCDADVISSKLRHLKRLLAKRFEAKHQWQAAANAAGAEEANQLAMRVLTALPGGMDPLGGERICVLVSATLSAEVEATIKGEMLAVSGFVSDVQMREEHVRFASMAEPEGGGEAAAGGSHHTRPSTIQIVVVGFNDVLPGEAKLDDLVLSEMCQAESVSWNLCGQEVAVSWVIRDMEPLVPGEAFRRDRGGHLVVCNAALTRSSITLFYPGGLAPFFSDESLHRAFEPGNFLNKVLADDVGSIRFLEWRQGSVRVPCVMPNWLANVLWDLARGGCAEVLALLEGPHKLCAIEMDGWAIALAEEGSSCGGVLGDERVDDILGGAEGGAEGATRVEGGAAKAGCWCMESVATALETLACH